MCGIAGILFFDKQQQVNKSKLDAMRESMIHRGPDFGDEYINNNIGLAHRRLSIIDLTTKANQPMISQDGRYVLIYNGEIYNFKELKNELILQGEQFYTDSDTEVLLKMYQCYQDKMLNKLNGMFSFAVWDNECNQLFIARGKAGMKPLFYLHINDSFIFASELKAILAYGHPAEIDEDGLNEFLLFRYVAGENTLFKGIQKLLPGHSITIDAKGSIKKIRWWDLRKEIQSFPTITKPVEWFRETFNDSVNNHMISDVPVGILLSGGLDSGAICASLAMQHFKSVQTFNVGFRNFSEDESLQAQNLARHFHFPFQSIQLEKEDLLENLAIANYVNDEPLVHQNEPQLVAVSRFAKKTVTVLLSGEGADEFLGGYVRYKPLKYIRYEEWIKSVLNILPDELKSVRLKKLQRYFGIADKSDLLLYNAVNNYPADYLRMGIRTSEVQISFREKILKEAQELYPDRLQRQMMYIDQHTYLNSLNDRNDRCTMAASVECRMPFLDNRLMAGLGTLGDEWFFKGNTNKYLLREACKNMLPATTLKFRKVGFSVPWVQTIYSTPKLKQHWDSMHQSTIFQYGLLRLLKVDILRNEFEKGNKTNEFLLRHLFFISLWWKQFNEQLSPVSLQHA